MECFSYLLRCLKRSTMESAQMLEQEWRNEDEMVNGFNAQTKDSNTYSLSECFMWYKVNRDGLEMIYSLVKCWSLKYFSWQDYDKLNMTFVTVPGICLQFTLHPLRFTSFCAVCFNKPKTVALIVSAILFCSFGGLTHWTTSFTGINILASEKTARTVKVWILQLRYQDNNSGPLNYFMKILCTLFWFSDLNESTVDIIWFQVPTWVIYDLMFMLIHFLIYNTVWT
jgi:hypothetical protein